MPFPDPKEKAVLTIKGQDYSEWESVQVKHTLVQAPYYTFRFTCSENQPIATNLQNLQILPRDPCTITLAGELAFQGVVLSRQVVYDATKHFIEIQGASNVHVLGFAHVVHETMEFNKKTPKQIIDELCKPHGIAFTEEGGLLPTDKIPNYNIAPGTTVMNAIETIMRSTGSTPLTSNLQGNLVAAVGPTGGTDTVREGDDILEGREIIYVPAIYAERYATGQNIPNDQVWGAAAAQMLQKSSKGSSGAGGTAKQVSLLEIPSFTNKLLSNRADMDSDFQNRDEVTVYITRQGWLRPSGGLWQRDQIVQVISPMLIMKGTESLQAKSVTFTQDNNTGTRTVLELCNANARGPTVPQAG